MTKKKKSFTLVWWWHQFLSGSLPNSHMSRVSFWELFTLQIYSGIYSCCLGYSRKFLLLFLHWFPLNLLILKGEYLTYMYYNLFIHCFEIWNILENKFFTLAVTTWFTLVCKDLYQETRVSQILFPFPTSLV